jgi:Protein of unknown function (DUF3631)
LSVGVRLLADCQDAFDGRDRLSTDELLEHLRGLEEAPWGDWHGKPLSPRKLAGLLKQYEIRSRSIRLPDGSRKGYLREWFEDVWPRYLLDPGSETSQRHNGSTKPETAGPEASQPALCDGLQSPETALESHCDAVTDTDAGTGNGAGSGQGLRE